MKTMMGVKEIPSNMQITTLLDEIDPDSLSSVFNENLHTVDERGSLKDFRCLDGGALLALDGVWYFSSEQIHCEWNAAKSWLIKQAEEYKWLPRALKNRKVYMNKAQTFHFSQQVKHSLIHYLYSYGHGINIK